MIVINRGPKDSIDKMLKRYKKKVKRTKLIQRLRDSREYEKPSSAKRKVKTAAIYKQKVKTDLEKNS